MVMGARDRKLLGRLLRLATAHGLSLATAESVTGGMVASWLTDLAGSSQIFCGGICAYREETKSQLLAVPPALITTHGVVSEAVARAMAEGARRVFSSSYAVATTGIAGPTGGTSSRPVGTVWCAVATPKETIAFMGLFAGGRSAVRLAATRSVLARLLLQIEKDWAHA